MWLGGRSSLSYPILSGNRCLLFIFFYYYISIFFLNFILEFYFYRYFFKFFTPILCNMQSVISLIQLVFISDITVFVSISSIFIF